MVAAGQADSCIFMQQNCRMDVFPALTLVAGEKETAYHSIYRSKTAWLTRCKEQGSLMLAIVEVLYLGIRNRARMCPKECILSLIHISRI